MKMSLWDGLKKSAVVLGVMAVVFISLYATLIFGSIFVGSLTEIVVSGDVPVTNATNTTVQALETSYGTTTTNITDNIGIILGFIALAVIVGILFATGIIRIKGVGGTGKADF